MRHAWLVQELRINGKNVSTTLHMVATTERKALTALHELSTNATPDQHTPPCRVIDAPDGRHVMWVCQITETRYFRVTQCDPDKLISYVTEDDT